MSPIKPHGPVQPDLPGLPASPRDQGGDTPFDNFLPGPPTPGTPIEETPPPAANPDDPRVRDPMKGIMPRPIRWKDGKTPSSGLPGTDVGSPIAPLPTPIDPQLVATAVAFPQSWTLLAPPSPENEGSPTDGGSAQAAPSPDVSSAGITGANAVSTPGTSPVETAATGLIRRLKANGSSDFAGPGFTGIQTPVAVVPRQTTPVDGTVTVQPRLTPEPGAPVAAPAVPSSPVADLPAIPLAADSSVTDFAPASPSSPAMNVSMTTLLTGLPPTLGEAALPMPTSQDVSPSPLQDSRLAGADRAASLPTGTDPSGAVPAADSRIVAAGMPPVHLPTMTNRNSSPSPLPDSRLASVDRTVSPPSGTDSSVAVPAIDSRIAATGMPPVTAAVPATVTSPAASVQVEISPSAARDRAKIAGSTTTESKSARKLEDQKSQVDGNETLIPDFEFDGTRVAKDEPAVNAALTANQKDSDASPLPKRGGAPAPGAVASSRTGNARPSASETLVNVALSKPVGIEAATTTVTPSQTPETTATRQAVPVETLLQHTLSMGENVRPSGTDRMEMRVRLDGGHEDVTVQMQVVNDRMQVTFQTNSPELRKALEHGWEQFSSNAAQTSTLSMSEPRFEASRVNAAPSNAQADTQSFSSNQQNPRRPETAATFGDEPAPSVASRRTDFAGSPALAPAAGQSAARRWTGWA